MRLRATVEGGPWRALDGGHRALSDTHATIAVLHALAHPLRSARRQAVTPPGSSRATS